MMESKAGNKKSKSSLFYEAPLGYSIEDVRPFGGIKKFKSYVCSNVSFFLLHQLVLITFFMSLILLYSYSLCFLFCCSALRGHPSQLE
ncbi:unnamed protein product [Brassica oleracea]